ncbi:MAG: FAD-dependent oxidoreductase [Thaumarchaeota archaeon]|nr:FAD-dependent oxidoreductase [Nitrososphaerota archaeon]
MNFLFPSLFSPLSIRNKTLRNRIVSSANFTALAENNLPSESFAYYHGEKARGGVALTITGELPVSETTKFAQPRSIFAFDKRSIPGFRMMTDRVHEYGGLASGQLIHTLYGMDYAGGPTVKIGYGPSPIPSLASPDRSIPVSLTSRQIEEEAVNYANTATNLIESGFDGIEIKSDAGSLPHQFFSPLTNARDDEYGGSLENRARFLRLVIDNVYRVTNGNLILGIKIPGDEFTRKGLSREDVKKVASILDHDGKIDYIAVASGHPGVNADYNTPSGYYPQGMFVELSQGIKEVISNRLKTMTLGRITEPEFADSIVASQKADFVIMMRALIADPELPRKAADGRLSEIIPCNGCNQGCLHRVLTNRHITCIFNPPTGREKEWGIGTITRSKNPKKVLIVGAGPAGIECARIAKMKGHDVRLYDQSDRIGGQVKRMSVLPNAKDTWRNIEFWKSELKRINVSVTLNHKVSAEDVFQESPDVVVCATGVRDGAPIFSASVDPPRGIENLHSTDEFDNYGRTNHSMEQVTIYDDRSDIRAIGWSEIAMDAGAKVTILTGFPMIGVYVEPHNRLTAGGRLSQKGVNIVADVVLKEIGTNFVEFFNKYSGNVSRTSSDKTYYVSSTLPDSSLWKSLRDSRDQFDLFAIGDCLSPRTIEEAVYEGHKLGRSV